MNRAVPIVLSILISAVLFGGVGFWLGTKQVSKTAATKSVTATVSATVTPLVSKTNSASVTPTSSVSATQTTIVGATITSTATAQ